MKNTINKLLNIKLPNSEEDTIYRIVKLEDNAKKYLTFLSTENNTNKLTKALISKLPVWRYIPNNESYQTQFLNEESCPTIITNNAQETLINNFYKGDRHEDGFEVFQKEYPRIEDYFTKQNGKRDELLEEKGKVSSAVINYGKKVEYPNELKLNKKGEF